MRDSDTRDERVRLMMMSERECSLRGRVPRVAMLCQMPCCCHVERYAYG